MYQLLRSYFPGRRFLTANVVLWLFMVTFSTDQRYRALVKAEQQVDWLALWVDYFPWWLPWAILSPIIVAGTRAIASKHKSWLKSATLHLLMLTCIFWLYGLMAVPLVTLIENSSEEFTLSAVKVGFQTWLSFNYWHLDFLIYLSVISAGFSLQYYQRMLNEKAHSETLSRQLVQAELQALKSQLNPHFLFNTLNTIASLIRLEHKDKAIRALSELSMMLRKVLENQRNQMVRLSQEMEFIQCYLSIQRMRFEEKLETKVEVDPACLEMEIPFMLLQPLVENAVQHGSQLESNKNLLSLKVHCSQGQLHIKLINKVPKQDEHKGFGIGISNCRERLERLYGGRFSFTLKELEDDYFETLLSFPAGDCDD
ncbi:histidine kinase [Aliiglaciecola sp. CAU 1673]|uniref:sensor histidine kinase n=1 Tax=Aliiglaciecola sp. CAU 1673 TaxID=3032595 RepID=UPI0023D9AA7A|nr:histidine kinase [Aliiglaciecola sp. CAU 1673]MDF2176807.1 histidine kinase [Aliiglaciecola sp. CAU 1673]